ncbi:MAG: acetyl/propionyl/methylcrotonyl-CoA carboxylase subunit alpha [Thermoleophilaceae bacterium]
MSVGANAIDRVLVANRGEIARRVFRTCRELGIATAAVFSDPDASAPFVREADRAVALGGATPEESYLRGDAIIAAARRMDADAIHPGYGFLAESADFARQVIDAGLTWIGPSPEAIAAMGSKVEARARMEAAGVPVVPGCTLDDHSPDGLRGAAEAVGYPLMVKASAGGGGRGMRVVRGADDLEGAVEGARREASAAFADDTLFLERHVDFARHVEIQIVGDAHGTVVSLFERDCSVQRRHQKVIEEAPCPVLDADTRARMGDAAVAAGQAIGYVGAGTVEFLLTPDGEFLFLEVNARLQVEHPVTEAVTGLDLVALQLLVAEGAPLPREALEATVVGHAIEARLYAEDPEHGFLPVSGTLERLAIGEGVRVDSGVESGSEVSPFYDPLLAKVVVHAPTRLEAARRLSRVLERAEIDGLVTNRDLLVGVLRHPEFLEGRADTRFLERHGPAELGAPALDADGRDAHGVAGALALQAGRRSDARVLSTLPSGWRGERGSLQRVTFEARGGALEVAYRLDRAGAIDALEVDGRAYTAPRLYGCTPTEVDLELDGVRRRYGVRTGVGAVYVRSELGQSALVERPRFPSAVTMAAPGSLTAPMPGTVQRVLVSAGEAVSRGDVLLVLEAMKMEHEVSAPGDGTVIDLQVGEGDRVSSGAVLAVIGTAGETA